MRARRLKLSRDKEKEKTPKKFILKYEKPKVLLIDLPDEVLESTHSAGFNASGGTFGSPYKVELGDEYVPVIPKAHLPNYTEQEIIFVNLKPPETANGPLGSKTLSKGENDWWCKCNKGEIDPRSRVMFSAKSDFNRILENGGLFVIFAEPRLLQTQVFAKIEHGSLHVREHIWADNWSFLSVIGNLTINAEVPGREITVPDSDHILFQFLRNNIKDAKYTATFSPSSRFEKQWIPILHNKFGNCVGGLIVPENSKGRILILPQISKKDDAVVTLLREVLPDLSPHLFPHIEGVRWVERDEYELVPVLNYKAGKVEVQLRAERELEELDERISKERSKLGFLHGILTKTDKELVVDVKSCLELIGFEKVIDVDEQIQKEDAKGPKQEDLQIHDKSPALLIEIKGISGLPHESDTIQVVKYVSRRMKEWKRTDVRGVAIINHQRNLPALERNNQNVFMQPQIEDAENHDIIILTSWDLFLLIRGMMKWGWAPNVIQELFYRSGRMPRYPSSYEPIGKIFSYWEKMDVVGVEITDNKLQRGDRIGYVLPRQYLEEEVLSLQVDNQDVEEAVAGQSVGIKTGYPKELLRKGTTVCRIRNQ